MQQTHMEERKLVYENGDIKAYIEREEQPFSPEDNHDIGAFLVAFHRSFSVSREDWTKERIESAMSSKDAEGKDDRKAFWFFPLEAYIHSGVALSLIEEKRAFPDRKWDVSSIGAVVISKGEFKTRVKALKYAKALVEEWQQYQDGDVWNVLVVRDKKCCECGLSKEEVLESCSGYYGEEYATQEVKREAMGYVPIQSK